MLYKQYVRFSYKQHLASVRRFFDKETGVCEQMGCIWSLLASLCKKRGRREISTKFYCSSTSLSRCVNKQTTLARWVMTYTVWLCVFKPVLMVRHWFSQRWGLRKGRNLFFCCECPKKTPVSCPRRASFLRMGWQGQGRALSKRQVPCCQPHKVRAHRTGEKSIAWEIKVELRWAKWGLGLTGGLTNISLSGK